MTKEYENTFIQEKRVRGAIGPVIKFCEGADQPEMLFSCYGARRFVYNYFLAKYTEHRKSHSKKIEYYKNIQRPKDGNKGRKLTKEESNDYKSCFLSRSEQQNELPKLKKKWKNILG